MSLILVVDDMAIFREPIAAALRGAGHEVLCAAGGLEALEIVSEGAPDLVVLDMSMPGMDGLAVLRTLRGRPHTARVPVVMLTAAADRDHVLRAAKLGVRDYLLKSDFKLADLLDRVSRHLSGPPAAATTLATAPEGAD